MMEDMNMENESKIEALSRIVNDLAKLFDTNLEALKQPVEVEIEVEKPIDDDGMTDEEEEETEESPDSMFSDLVKRKKLEE